MPFYQSLQYNDFEILIFPDVNSTEIFPKTRIIPTGKRGPAEKRDLAIKYAKGEIFAFIDDDAYPRRDWLTNAVRHFKNNEIAAVGGPAVTAPDDDIWQKASGEVYASRIGGGSFTYRHIPQKMREVDDYPSVNLIIRRNIFEQLGGFDSLYYPGEDTKLCLDITKKLNKKILYDPEVLVWHHRRSLFIPHLKQISNYGIHRGFFAKKFPETSLRIGYFIPTFFTSFFLTAPLGYFYKPYGLVFGTITITYILLLFSSVIRLKNPILAFLTSLGIFSTHLTYGICFVVGFCKKRLIR